MRFWHVISLSVWLVVGGCDQSTPTPSGKSPQPGSAGATTSSPNGNAPASKPTAIAAQSNAPLAITTIKFESTQVDLGTFSEAEQRTAMFKFTNTGDHRLVIDQVKTSCGCTAAKLARTEYQPGESGTIEVTLTPTAPGREPKLVNVIANTQPELTRLVLHNNITAFLEIEPRIINPGVLQFRKKHEFTVTVYCPPDDRFGIEKVTTTNPELEARVLPESPGSRSRTIQVTIPASATWGSFFSWLEITARGRPRPDAQPISHTSKIRVQAQLFGQIHASPDAFRFGVKPGEAFEREIVLERVDGQPLDISSATVTACELPGTTVEVKRLSPSRQVLILRSTGDKIRAMVQGQVIVATNVPGEEQIMLPIQGVVRIIDPSVQ